METDTNIYYHIIQLITHQIEVAPPQPGASSLKSLRHRDNVGGACTAPTAAPTAADRKHGRGQNTQGQQTTTSGGSYLLFILASFM